MFGNNSDWYKETRRGSRICTRLQVAKLSNGKGAAPESSIGTTGTTERMATGPVRRGLVAK